MFRYLRENLVAALAAAVFVAAAAAQEPTGLAVRGDTMTNTTPQGETIHVEIADSTFFVLRITGNAVRLHNYGADQANREMLAELDDREGDLADLAERVDALKDARYEFELEGESLSERLRAFLENAPAPRDVMNAEGRSITQTFAVTELDGRTQVMEGRDAEDLPDLSSVEARTGANLVVERRSEYRMGILTTTITVRYEQLNPDGSTASFSATEAQFNDVY
ncbi:MAG: hypothetical protein ACFE0P_05475 [Oceanicaulis sp.]